MTLLPPPISRLRSVGLALAAALVLSLLASAPAPAEASAKAAGVATTVTTSAATATTGRVRGEILGAKGQGTPKVKVAWFTLDWQQLGSRSFTGGAYSLNLPEGRYRLQFTDQRPSYDVSRYAPTDKRVQVTAGTTTVASVRMRPGGAIGGVARAGGKLARGAKVVAANKDERSWSTTANKRGQFALGGLPAGTYSIFTYDKRHRFVGKSIYIKRLRVGQYRSIKPTLTTRAGSLLVDIYLGDTAWQGSNAYLTAVSRTTGQFWTAKARQGSVTFRGLYPGKYRIVVPGIGNYFGATRSVSGKVKPGRAAFGSVRLSERGAWVSGRVVDQESPSSALSGASVSLLDASGAVLATTTSSDDGTFLFEGQLVTQDGLTVRYGPGPYSDYLGTSPNRCEFTTTTSAAFSIVTGQETALGDVALRRKATQDDPNCVPEDPAAQEARR
ncbi:carboxypeptidase-like regulatory domain-containing protein [Nocardioides acrostichi]|uniref:Carboxypeptidase regulatory-like domain-containing protein n=1 Tax=Nocardioides acrostichi TaxID=2784339 RepID=A0A930Y705_9ACTN|nr:carboxypeptidase-like regulatory domain-containing protein [Nocardioides acrostichi]MBF4162920.1 carboxypeptidase regulatory-like domain-containing protein [Nocardioides acrostichi]